MEKSDVFSFTMIDENPFGPFSIILRGDGRMVHRDFEQNKELDIVVSTNFPYEYINPEAKRLLKKVITSLKNPFKGKKKDYSLSVDSKKAIVSFNDEAYLIPWVTIEHYEPGDPEERETVEAITPLIHNVFSLFEIIRKYVRQDVDYVWLMVDDIVDFHSSSHIYYRNKERERCFYPKESYVSKQACLKAVMREVAGSLLNLSSQGYYNFEKFISNNL
ncbi:MAG: hypothetical protein K5694_07245, partial [Bacilli bacterium]|nr:hypothetical protein [Bacilli bacterium]